MTRMYLTESARDRQAARLRRRRIPVTCFNVTDGSGTTYGLDYQPRKEQR